MVKFSFVERSHYIDFYRRILQIIHLFRSFVPTLACKGISLKICRLPHNFHKKKNLVGKDYITYPLLNFI